MRIFEGKKVIHLLIAMLFQQHFVHIKNLIINNILINLIKVAIPNKMEYLVIRTRITMGPNQASLGVISIASKIPTSKQKNGFSINLPKFQLFYKKKGICILTKYQVIVKRM